MKELRHTNACRAGLAFCMALLLMCNVAAAQDANQPAGPETLTISLDELLGEYQPGAAKTIALDPSTWDWIVAGAYLRLTGYIQPGQADGFTPPPEFEVGIRNDPAGGFTAVSQQSSDGLIELEILLAADMPGLDNFLSASPGEIGVLLASTLGLDLSQLPSMQISKAELVVQGQPTVAIPEPVSILIIATGSLILLRPKRSSKIPT